MPQEAPAHDVKDQLLTDACDTQRRKGQIPTVADNERWLTEILDRLDRKRADQKPSQVSTPERRPGALDREIKKRTKKLGRNLMDGWSLSRVDGVVLEPQRVKNEAEKRLRKRVRFLARHPEWRRSVQSVAWQLRLCRDPEATKKYIARFWRIMRKADKKFGSWKKPAPRKVFGYVSNRAS